MTRALPITELSPRYIPCRCWSADHLIRIDVDEDDHGELYVSILSSRDFGFWRRVRWALKHVFGRQDLVFADVIIRREELLEALEQPGD